jgi:flavin reductase (DIM6/NTAB) family NADH-FMN oxidoreductase RutF
MESRARCNRACGGLSLNRDRNRMTQAMDVPLPKAARLVNHGPTVLVTTADGARRNVMAAAWIMAVDFDPPKLAVVIDAGTLTRQMITATGRFGVTVPPRALLDLTEAVGQVSGRDLDKFAAHGIETLDDPPGALPRIRGGVAWLDCEVIPEPGVARAHDLLVARITRASADPRAFADGRWLDGPPELRTLHHSSGGTYFVAGAMVRARGSA